MKNIFSAKIAINAEISFLESQLKACIHIKEELEKLGEVSVVESSNDENLTMSDSKPNINPEDFKDYPFNKRLFEKLNYLDQKYPKAWSMRDRLELMVLIEGEAVRERLEKYMSNDLKSLVQVGAYVGAKYNNENKFQFYYRPE